MTGEEIPAASEPPAVAVASLSKRFGRGPSQTCALRDVSFAVAAGEVFALLGPNGAGKSTLVRILATLLRASGGRAEVAGIDVTARPADARRAIGVALQDVGVDPAQRVEPLVRLHARLHGASRGASRERARELIELLGLDGVAARRAATLSGGMRRRLDLALALVHRPHVLLLDEPTTGLDAASRRELWRELGVVRAAGTTIVLTTQHLDEAERLADRVAILNGGRIAAVGAPAALSGQLAHTVLEAGFADRRQAAAAASLLGDGAAVVGLRVRAPVSGEPAAVARAIDRLESHGLDASSLALSQPTLEDAFLAILAREGDGEQR